MRRLLIVACLAAQPCAAGAQNLGLQDAANRMAGVGGFEPGRERPPFDGHDVPPVGPERSRFDPWAPPWGGNQGWEVPSCPPSAYPSYAPWEGYQQPYQYLGYRWLRTDDTTCSPLPSDRIWFSENASASAALPAGDAAATLRLSSRVYRVARIFFRAPPDSPSISYVDQREYAGRATTLTAAVSVANRAANPPLPWESESIVVYFDGRTVNARPQNPSYSYNVAVSQGGMPPDLTAQVTLTPLAKLVTQADPNGLTAQLQKTADGKSFVIVLADMWPGYYPNQNIVITYTVKRHRLVLDPTAFQGSAQFGSAAQYAIDLSKAAPQEALKPGEPYYAEIRFRRLGGTVSTQDELRIANTPQVKF
ncbi:MAG: hypothetical protein NTX64_05645 [Elusimicrobia bacterium]|nr:hypothetical protein [Elusimicrobiota bacterium]